MSPVVVQIRPRKAVILGLIFLPFALFGLGFLIMAFQLAKGSLLETLFNAATLLGILATLGFGFGSVMFFGIALRRPVALRMDEGGISGFYAPPATWSEIAEIGKVTNSNNQKCLGFRLQDPISYRDRQTAWGRFNSWSNGRSSGFHLIIPEVLLKETSIDDLVTQARAFHAAATIA